MIAQLDLLSDEASSDRIGPLVVCIGVFDGVHLGHQLLVEQTILSSQESDLPSGIITFDIDPDEIKGADFVKLISNQERLELLEQTGVDCILALSFDKELRALSAQDFLEKLLQRVDMKTIVVGSNFRFGAKAAGDVALLSQFCSEHSIVLSVIDLLEVDDEVVSSERIRVAFAKGNFIQAEKLLGHSL